MQNEFGQQNCQGRERERKEEEEEREKANRNPLRGKIETQQASNGTRKFTRVTSQGEEMEKMKGRQSLLRKKSTAREDEEEEEMRGDYWQKGDEWVAGHSKER